MPGSPAAARETPEDFYLPDLCTPTRVLGTVLTTVLAAVLVSTARLGLAPTFWGDLARTSMLLLWVALPSTALLCGLRPRLARLGVTRGSSAALGLILAVTLVVSETAWWAAAIGLRRTGADLALGVGHGAFLTCNLTLALFIGGLLLRYFYVSDQRRRHLEGSARARVDALQARIRPHFLYNSMNTIASLTRSDPVAAEHAVLDLADLFRASLSETRNVVRLADELEIAGTYQRIEQLRLGSRLGVDWQVEAAALEAPVPGMFLQPLLENAIYHGIERLPAGGTVTVAARLAPPLVEIVVDNPLPTDADAPGRAGNRVALANLRERLLLLYGGAGRFESGVQADRFVVRLAFPATPPAPTP
jgi:two-component system sensor histidine kinase AlgZ